MNLDLGLDIKVTTQISCLPTVQVQANGSSSRQGVTLKKALEVNWRYGSLVPNNTMLLPGISQFSIKTSTATIVNDVKLELTCFYG